MKGSHCQQEKGIVAIVCVTGCQPGCLVNLDALELVLNLSTVFIWAGQVFVVGTFLCIVGYLEASLA